MRKAVATSGTPSSVTVAVRVRPLNEREKQMPDQAFALDIGDKSVSLPNDSNYVYDAVFGPEHSTQDLYEAIAEPIVSSSLAGINGTIFAYGQTASGKTFSMQGSDDHPGILRLAARQLFEVAKDAQWTYSFVVSYIEIYNERVKDLMSTATGRAQDAASDLKIREDRQNGFYVDGMTERAVTDYESLIEHFEEGEKRRHVAGTDMNLKSSRSHTIFTINVIAKQKPNETGDFAFGTLKSRLSLVDLAGSESARLTNAEGDRLKEGAQINKSLLALSLVISTLAKTTGKDAHVKFRDSKLTQILQPALAGNCRTAVVCCVTPAASFLSETSSTLKFASSAKHIHTQYVVNQIADVSRSIKSYQDQVEALAKSLREEQQARSVAERAAEAHGAEQLLKLERRITELQQDVQRLEEERDNAAEGMARKTEEAFALQEELSQRHVEEKQMDEIRKQIETERDTWKAYIEELKLENARQVEAMKTQVDKEREEFLARSSQTTQEWEHKLKEMETRLEDSETTKNLLEQERGSLSTKCDELTNAMESTCQELQDERMIHKTLEQRIIDMENDHSNAMQNKQSELEEAARKHAEALQSLRNEMETQLQNEIALHREQVDSMTVKLVETEREYESRLKEESKKREILQAELVQLGEKSDSSVQALIAAKQELERKLDAVETEMTMNRKAHAEQLKVMEDRAQSLSETNELVQRQLQDTRAQSESFENQLAEEQARLKEKECALQDQLKKEQTRALDLEAQLSKTLEDQREAMAESTCVQEDLNNRITAEMQRSQGAESSLKETKQRLAIALEEISTLKQEKTRMAEEHRAEVDQLQMQDEQSEESQAAYWKTEFMEKKREVRDLSTRLTDMKKLYEEELKEMREEMEQQEREHQRKQAPIPSLSTDQEQVYQKTISDLEVTVATLQSEVKRLDSVKMTNEIMEKFKRMKVEREELRNRVRQLQEYESKYHGLRSMQEKLKTRHLDMIDEENKRPPMRQINENIQQQ